MSRDVRALVPIEAWSYSSPDVKDAGNTVDVGLLGESLVYYDRIVLQCGNPEHFAELLDWFTSRGVLDEFYALIREGTIQLLEYSFASAPVLDNRTGTYSIV